MIALWLIVAFLFLVSGLCGVARDLIDVKIEEKNGIQKGIWYKIVKMRLNLIFLMLALVLPYLGPQVNIVYLLPIFSFGGVILLVISIYSLYAYFR